MAGVEPPTANGENRGPALNQINFPLYSVSALSSNYVIVTGGGGAANTGVFNGFAICEIGVENKDKDYVIYEIQRHSTYQSAIMNSTIGSFNNGRRIFLAAGKDADCFIYQIKLGTTSQRNSIPDAGVGNSRNQGDRGSRGEADVRQRHQLNGDVTNRMNNLNKPTSSTENETLESKYSDLMFNIQTIQSVQTDFSLKDPCQNCVAFSTDGRLVITGGADGYVRIWNFPEMKLKTKIEASKKDILDLDISPDRQLVSSVSGGKCKIWSVLDGKLKFSLDLPPEDEKRFMYKRAKFGVVEDKRNIYRVFAILNPTSRKDKSYLQHWTGPNPFTLTRAKEVGETLSALAISKCGKYLAIGSMESGDVAIYISFGELNRIKHVQKAHKTFVTGLTFLPPAEPNEEYVLANCDAAVVSVSVDNRIRVHHIERTSGISVWLAVLLVIVVLFCTFTACSYFNL